MTTTYNPGNSTTSNTITITGTGSSSSSYTLTSPVTMSTTIPITNITGGSTLASNGYSYNWATSNDTVMSVSQNPPTLDVKGNVVINGLDLEERLKTIETVLHIPERDVKLEKKHPNLKKMYDDYIKALGKYRTWEAIKGDDNGNT